ncbi:MAG: U32 family peptidase [Candidatus Gracilibacteria bacterium]
MFKKIVGLGFSSKGKNAKDVGEYIKSLVDSGAGEFFTGYNPLYWYEKFGFEVSPNGRFAEHEQITDFETLKQIVEEVHSHNLEIFVNLNAWYYTNETFPIIQKMVEEIISIGFDGIICGNIGILEYLKEINYTGKINISTILALYNSEAIRFFIENYKVNKIILSREITLKEIENIALEFSDIDFEVFGEGDFCRYNNGLCFAEHKYGSKDICTVVINDLIIKNRFKPDYKKIILDNNSTNIEKTGFLNNDYKDPFSTILEILENIEIGIYDKEYYTKNLILIIKGLKNRIDLYYDSLKQIEDKKNKEVISLLRGLNYLLNDNNSYLNLDDRNDFLKLKEELDNSVKSGISYNLQKEKEVGGKTKIKSLELASFYSRTDNLNLYAFLFFSKFKNIITMKFPTRGRHSINKFDLIKKVVESGKVDKSLIDRGTSIERSHYDLTHIFKDKLWFRKLINK